ncbi:hypothetical protein D3C75_1170700 [compost metagenome]
MLVQCPLGRYPHSRVLVVQGRQQRMNLKVGGAAFDADGTLATGRQAVFNADG